jgi:hypothetical protein
MTPPDYTLATYLADSAYLAWRTLACLCLILFGLAANLEPEKPAKIIDQTRVSLTSFDSVTGENLSSIPIDPSDHARLLEKVMPRLRMLRLVIERLPKTFIPHSSWPAHKLTYYLEKLECGHEKLVFETVAYPKNLPPTAKRRLCSLCQAAALAEVPKKPVSSVRRVEEREQEIA